MLLFLVLCVSIFIPPSKTEGASSPYNVPSSVKSNWDNTYGEKTYSMTSGKKLVYDVYTEKGIKGGYQIVNKNFGQGTQPYINFEGFAILFGHAKHTYANNETYIVARDTSNGNTKIYSTLKQNSLSATKDLEFNKQSDTGLYNECPLSARNKNNRECNMRYNNVDFQAYLPINELFPDPSKAKTYELYIVKKVNNQLVYTPLILPFTFDNLTHNEGEISLSSGVNANNLIMIGNDVLRRDYPDQPQRDVVDKLGSDRYFYNRTYKRTSSDQSNTVIWYGVRSKEDGNKIKMANTAYWRFGGSQATLSFSPDDVPPKHISHDLTGHRYKNGNDYWVQPEDTVDVRLRGRDKGSLLNRTTIRLDGSGAYARARHYYNSGLDYYDRSIYIDIPSSKKTYESSASYSREATYSVKPKSNTHGHNYDISAWHSDNAGNSTGWVDTKMNLRVDGVDPTNKSTRITGFRYNNDDEYWIRPNENVDISLRGYDADSLLNRSVLRLDSASADARVRFHYNKGSSNYDYWYDDPTIDINSGTKTYESASKKTREATWNVTAKEHGQIYNIMSFHADNVDNSEWYKDTGKLLGVDGEGPIHKSYSFDGNYYKEDTTYWVQPNEQIKLTLSGRDDHSGMERQYLRFDNSSEDIRSYFNHYTNSFSPLTNYNSQHIEITNAIPNSKDSATFDINPKTHGHKYNIKWVYRDNVHNWSKTNSYGNGVYIDTGSDIGIDGEAPNVSFSPNSQDWTEGTIDVNISITDEDSGVKRFRYRTQNEEEWGSWSQWAEGTSEQIIIEKAGKNQIEVEAEDNVGNKQKIKSSYYYINNPPVADFDWTPKPIYEGDTMTLTNMSVDPDGHDMTAKWSVTKPNGETNTFTSWDLTLPSVLAGDYTIKLEVTDEPGGKDQISKTISVIPLEIHGEVYHTDYWKTIHDYYEHDDNLFYSGERFMLKSLVTDYPLDSIKVEFVGYKIDNTNVKIVENLENFNVVNDFREYNGSIYEEFMSQPDTKLKRGTAFFNFKATWSNGVIKNDVVEVEIIDDVFEPYEFHRTN